MREPTKLPAGEHAIARLCGKVDGPTHHYQGYVQIAVYASGVWMQWDGENEWYSVSWWEMAHFAHATPPKLRDELQWERDDARSRGIQEALEDIKRNPELWRKP